MNYIVIHDPNFWHNHVDLNVKAQRLCEYILMISLPSFIFWGSFQLIFLNKRKFIASCQDLSPNRPYQELWFLFQPVRLNESTNAVSTVQRCVSLSVNMERNIQIIRYQYYEDIHIIPCPKVYRPVCASNGAANITFTNECQLQVPTIIIW